MCYFIQDCSSVFRCYTEKATEATHRLERQYNACANRKKQCRPNETKPYSSCPSHRKTLLHEKYAPRTRARKGTCTSSRIVFWIHCPGKHSNPLSTEEAPFHAPKVALATQPPATYSRRRPSAPKGTRKVAIEHRNFTETLLTTSFHPTYAVTFLRTHAYACHQ